MHKINYTKLFTLTIRYKSQRKFLAIVAMMGIILIQIDMVGIYLESALGQNKQLIYMKVPKGYLASQKRLICQILKSLYGLKQIERL